MVRMCLGSFAFFQLPLYTSNSHRAIDQESPVTTACLNSTFNPNDNNNNNNNNNSNSNNNNNNNNNNDNNNISNNSNNNNIPRQWLCGSTDSSAGRQWWGCPWQWRWLLGDRWWQRTMAMAGHSSLRCPRRRRRRKRHPNGSAKATASLGKGNDDGEGRLLFPPLPCRWHFRRILCVTAAARRRDDSATIVATVASELFVHAVPSLCCVASTMFSLGIPLGHLKI